MAQSSGQKTSDILTVKGNYHSEKSGIYGLFIFVFNSETKTCDKSVILSTEDKRVLNIPLNTTWYDFEDKINELKWGGESKSLNIANDIKGYFDSYVNADSSFYSLVNSKNLSNIKEELVRLFYKPLDDTNIKFDVKIENILKSEYERKVEERYNNVSKESSSSSADMEEVDLRIPTNAKLITVDFLLSPLKGKSIFDLNVGDKIIVKLNRKNPNVEYLANSFKLDIQHDEDTGAPVDYIPLPAEVYQIDIISTGEYVVICKIKDNIYSRTIERERVNIRTFNPVTDRIELLKGSGGYKQDSSKHHHGAISSQKGKKDFKADKLLITLIILGLLTFAALIYLIYQSTIF